ncbi:protein-arginine kinase [Synergistales bacterium]|nr:protein-arginine kinase [Synergistales bacterium]
MTPETFITSLPAWALAPEMENGADSITVMSGARARRNIAGFAFPRKCGKSGLYDLAAITLDAIGQADPWRGGDFRMVDKLGSMERGLLAEVGMMTPLLANGGPGRFVMRDEKSSMTCMINEEDHISVIAARAGLDTRNAAEAACKIDDVGLNFVNDSLLGYLTANPSYAGSGVTVSVSLHLPALEMSGDMPMVCDSFARDWKNLSLNKLAAEKAGQIGQYDEFGSFFTVSNRTTLSTSPAEAAARVSDAAGALASKELFVRQKLLASRGSDAEDAIWRAWGVLRHARRLSLCESIKMLSLAKLGSDLGILPRIPNRDWKVLCIRVRKYHLMSEYGDIKNESDEASARAERFREFMTRIG